MANKGFWSGLAWLVKEAYGFIRPLLLKASEAGLACPDLDLKNEGYSREQGTVEVPRRENDRPFIYGVFRHRKRQD